MIAAEEWTSLLSCARIVPKIKIEEHTAHGPGSEDRLDGASGIGSISSVPMSRLCLPVSSGGMRMPWKAPLPDIGMRECDALAYEISDELTIRQDWVC